ncbi:MAG TPA: DinB family protein [Candidatus Dormibacteraeota bacterium]
MSNEALLEAFRHNTWATRQLLAFCRDLSEEQLTTPVTGTYGGIVATFNHIVQTDGGYLRRLAGSAPASQDGDESADLDELDARVEETGKAWERFLSEPVDAERVIVVAQGASEVRAGVFIAQALHHGNAHREQICAILTAAGIEPPDVQAWGYAVATGRLWERNAAG